jgi:hypothetical protein
LSAWIICVRVIQSCTPFSYNLEGGGGQGLEGVQKAWLTVWEIYSSCNGILNNFKFCRYHNQEVGIYGFLAQDLSIIGFCVHQKHSIAESAAESKSKQ